MKQSSKQKRRIHHPPHASWQPTEGREFNALITKNHNSPKNNPCQIELLWGGPADGELDSAHQRPQCLSFLVAINYDSLVSSAKAIGLRGVLCKKTRERFQDRDAIRSGFRLLRSRPRRNHSRVSRRPRRYGTRSGRCRGHTKCCPRKKPLIALQIGSKEPSRCGAATGIVVVPLPGSGRRPRQFSGRFTSRTPRFPSIPSFSSHHSP